MFRLDGVMWALGQSAAGEPRERRRQALEPSARADESATRGVSPKPWAGAPPTSPSTVTINELGLRSSGSGLVVNLWGLIQARGYEHAPGADTSMWKQNLKPRSGRCHVGEESLEGTVFLWGHEVRRTTRGRRTASRTSPGSGHRSCCRSFARSAAAAA